MSTPIRPGGWAHPGSHGRRAHGSSGHETDLRWLGLLLCLLSAVAVVALVWWVLT